MENSFRESIWKLHTVLVNFFLNYADTILFSTEADKGQSQNINEIRKKYFKS